MESLLVCYQAWHLYASAFYLHVSIRGPSKPTKIIIIFNSQSLIKLVIKSRCYNPDHKIKLDQDRRLILIKFNCINIVLGVKSKEAFVKLLLLSRILFLNLDWSHPLTLAEILEITYSGIKGIYRWGYTCFIIFKIVLRLPQSMNSRTRFTIPSS